MSKFAISKPRTPTPAREPSTEGSQPVSHAPPMIRNDVKPPVTNPQTTRGVPKAVLAAQMSQQAQLTANEWTPVTLGIYNNQMGQVELAINPKFMTIWQRPYGLGRALEHMLAIADSNQKTLVAKRPGAHGDVYVFSDIDFTCLQGL